MEGGETTIITIGMLAVINSGDKVITVWEMRLREPLIIVDQYNNMIETFTVLEIFETVMIRRITDFQGNVAKVSQGREAKTTREEKIDEEGIQVVEEIETIEWNQEFLVRMILAVERRALGKVSLEILKDNKGMISNKNKKSNSNNN